MYRTGLFFPRVVYSSGGMGGGGSFQPGDFEEEGDGGDGSEEGGEESGDGTITGDNDSDFDLDKFFNPDNSEDGDGSGGGNQNGNQGQQGNGEEPDPEAVAMNNNLRQGIEGLQLSDEAFRNEDGSEVNFNDPQQVRELFNRSMRHSAATALRLIFQPLQAALTRQQENLLAEMDNRIHSNTSSTRINDLLTAEIDVYSKPGFKQTVDGLVQQAQRNGMNDPTQIVSNVKKALKAMNIKFQPSRGGGGQGNGGGNAPSMKRSGASALDLFVPLPRKVNNQSQQRNPNGTRKT